MEVQKDFELENRKVQIAVPSYSNSVSFEWVAAMRESMSEAASYGCEVSADILGGCGLITNSRIELAAKFLNSDADTLFFIDDDVVWDASDFLRMVAWTSLYDMVGGVYCHRQDPAKFTAKFQKTPNGAYVQNQFGLLKADWVPGGFLAIRRSALENVWEKYKQDLGFTIRETEEASLTGVGLWLQYIGDNEGKRELFGEDIAFCNRWREAGGDIWVDPYLKLIHQGKKNYSYQIQNTLFKKDK